MRLAYADPPYPGRAHLYADHPDYAGEVDHRELVATLTFFCVNAQRQVVAHVDHVGRTVCPACGERVLPVVLRRSA